MAHWSSRPTGHEHSRPDQSVLFQAVNWHVLTISSATIFDHKIPAPIMFAPIGINKLYSPLGELVPAKIAGELGLPVSRSQDLALCTA